MNLVERGRPERHLTMGTGLDIHESNGPNKCVARPGKSQSPCSDTGVGSKCVLYRHFDGRMIMGDWPSCNHSQG